MPPYTAETEKKIHNQSVYSKNKEKLTMVEEGCFITPITKVIDVLYIDTHQ